MTSEERIAAALKLATDTKVYKQGQGVYAEAPAVFKELFPGRKAAVIADINTWPALGERVYNLFVEAGIETVKYIIDKEEFHAEWQYVEMVGKIIEGDFEAAKAIEDNPNHVEADKNEAYKPASEDYYIAVSVGSGVINDLCKLCSFQHEQQYLTLPTAASVDGYSSFGASISYQNAKQTFSCPAPAAIIADIDVIAAAPRWLSAAGYGDLASKVPAGAEWMIADLFGTEPIQPDAWHVLQDDLDSFLGNPAGVANGEPQAIADLFEGLTLSGIAMQAARSSRPASCSEHLFSHILDMTHYRFNGKLQSHGIQVSVGTVTMCAVFDVLFNMDFTKLDVDACVAAWPSLEEEQKRALAIFEGFPVPDLGYVEITKKYNDAETVRKQLTALKETWPEFKKKLQGQVYSYEKMKEMLKVAGAPCDPSAIGVTRQMLKEMVDKVQLMRFRMNVFDLAKRAGCYDELVEGVFAVGGPLDLTQDLLN